MGCSFGEGKRIDHAGSWIKSKKSRNNIVCSRCCTRQFAEQSYEHSSRSSFQLVHLPHRRIKLFCHTLLLKTSPPSSAAPPALPALWEHRPPLPQWGKTTKRTIVFFPGLTQVTSLTKQLHQKVICQVSGRSGFELQAHDSHACTLSTAIFLAVKDLLL